MWSSALDSYFAKGVRRFTESQIEPFEDFLHSKLPLVLRSTPPIVVWHEQDEATKKYKYEFRLSFDNVSYVKPRIQEATGRIKIMMPQEARVRNFTYAAQMFVDVNFTVRTYKGAALTEYDEQSKVFEGISLGKIPVMLGSSLCNLSDFPTSVEELGECPKDPLGYFIIHGSERTILSQEKVADNRIMVFQNKKSSTKYSYFVEMKSLNESFTMPPKKLEIRMQSKFNGLGYPMTVCIPRFREDIPLVVLFRALGMETDEDIATLIGVGDLLAASFKDAADMSIFTQTQALDYLSHQLQYPSLNEDKHEHVRNLLQTECMPHVELAGESLTPEVSYSRKLLNIAAMVRRLTHVKRKPLDDRDAYPNKRVVTTGALLTHLFRQLFQKVCKDIRGKFVHEINNDHWKKGESPKPLDALTGTNIFKILKVSSIEGKLKQALATGNFTVQGLGTSGSTSLSNATKAGVSQVLNRLSYNATLSHLRRIQTPVEKSGKLIAPRKLHGSSWGFICPVETPEGHSVGIVKTMSVLSAVSSHVPSFVVLNELRKLREVRWVDSWRTRGAVSIVVNGVYVAYTDSPSAVYTALKTAKTSCIIHPQISIAWHIAQNQICIETDAGRLVRPVFRVVKGNLLPAPADPTRWENWVQSCVEYIDANETECSRIAHIHDEVTDGYTHCEIHPHLIFGHMACTIPLMDHNQSPRNTYQSAMGKQSLSLYAKTFHSRLDKNAYILCSPQRPLVETRIMRTLHAEDMPFGCNAIVAIACYSGYNQEDSVLINRDSMKRGFMRGLYYTMYKDEEHRNIASGREERFMKPRKESTRGFKNSSYAAVEDTGIPKRNAVLQENDVIIGKVVNLKGDPHNYLYRDVSTTHKSSETCRVDNVWQDKNSDGYPFTKVRVVSERMIEIGDKVSSRHGQKGTCGMLLNECDMPFTASGLRPDIIMNPHAVPSRMTIAQLLETLYGRIGTRKGTIGDGTPFSHLKIDELRKQMVELGLHPYGNEIMYNGQTGEMMEVEIFIGSTFYQRLKHMVIDKKHSRGRGPIVSLTRQPCEGRSRDGGLRVGEMERDCMISHGAAAFTKERLMDVSDPFPTGVCTTCGILAVHNERESLYECKGCGNKTSIAEKTIPYALKLWTQELEAMHIKSRMVF
jgi:DNA-directed RNA polymerase II subunit RPB2